ncbi:MAG TPA: ABC transporter permease, partial [Acidimicrobiia bacterium]|nr:ABC transporter permease [Acidimicrobiia bacterium]
MRSLLPFIITGAVTGSLYGLAGLGLVLTFRTSGILNFGHGAIAAGAAFTFYTLHVTHGIPWPLAALVTIAVFGVVVGSLLERLTRGLSDVPQAVVVVTTVGLLLGIQGLLVLQYGPITRQFPEFLPTSGFTVAGVSLTWSQVISVVIATASAAGLYAFLGLTRLGVAMRAVVDNPALVGLCGDRAAQVRRSAWAIGCAFAALSGVLIAPTLGLDATLLTFLVVQALGACAVGLFTSLPLTYAGGILVGVLASVATRYLTAQPWNGVPSSVPYLVLIAVLLVVPVRRLPQARLSVRALVKEPAPLSRRTGAALAAAGGAALLLVPALVGPKLPVWISGLIYVVIFGSLALVVWVSGQISLCHAAFTALGATTMAHLTHAGVPWPAALVLAGLLTVPVGAVVAIPALRLSGVYLALVTLGFGILMQNVVYQTSFMFGRALTVTAPRPVSGFVDGGRDRWMYVICLVVAALTCGLLAAVYRSRLGRLLRAMAETPTMLSTHGLDVNITRLIVFCLSAFLAGIGGALLITQFGAASSVTFGPLQSLLLMSVLAICGTRLLRSSILAAAAFAVVPGYLGSFNLDRQILAF